MIESEYKEFDEGKRQLYTADTLREICLGLHSLCKGAESKFFNGYTNIKTSEFVTFGVKGLLQASRNLRSALLLAHYFLKQQPVQQEQQKSRRKHRV